LRRGDADELGVGSGDHCQLPKRRGAKSAELSAGWMRRRRIWG
jgi:hypothetical protein